MSSRGARVRAREVRYAKPLPLPKREHAGLSHATIGSQTKLCSNAC